MRRPLLAFTLLAAIFAAGGGMAGAAQEATPDATATASGDSNLGGNASGLLPAGKAGVVDPVVAGTYDGKRLPVVVRNNTDEAVVSVRAAATVRAADGSLLGAGDESEFIPADLAPGDYGLGYIYFDEADFPREATFEVTTSSSAPTPSSAVAVQVTIDEALYADVDGAERIIGFVLNTSNTAVTGGVRLAAMCLDADGNILGWHQATTDSQTIDPGGTTFFQISTRTSRAGCTNFVIGASAIVV